MCKNIIQKHASEQNMAQTYAYICKHNKWQYWKTRLVPSRIRSLNILFNITFYWHFKGKLKIGYLN